MTDQPIRFTRLLPAFVVALLALAWSGLHLGPFAATLTAGLVVLVVPGALALAAWPSRRTLTLPEYFALSAAISWCVVAALCIAAFKLAMPLSTALSALMVTEGLVAGLCWWRGSAQPIERLDSLHVALCVLWVVVGAAFYNVGGYTDSVRGPAVAEGWSTMEEGLQVSTVRKIVGAPALAPAAVMYAKGEIPTYIYPVHAFGLAAFSAVSGLDPLIAYSAFRFWSTVLSLAALYSLLVVAVNRNVAGIGSLVLALMACFVFLGSMNGSWSPLAALPHIGDFSLGVLLPLGLALVVHAVTRPPDVLTAAAPVFLLAMSLTHMREGVHVLSYMAAGLGVGLAAQSWRRSAYLRLAVLTVALVIAIVVIGRHITSQVPFIAEQESASSARTRIELVESLRSGISIDGEDNLIPAKPVIVLALLLAPWVWLWFRDQPGIVLLTAGLVAWAVPVMVPIIARLLELSVYSEVMMSPARYMVQVSLLMLVSLIAVAISTADWLVGQIPTSMRHVHLHVDSRSHDLSWLARHRDRVLVIGAVVVVRVCLGMRETLLAALGAAPSIAVVALVGFSVMAALSVRLRTPVWRIDGDWSRGPRGAASVVAIIALVAVVGLLASSQTVFDALRAARVPPRDQLADWYGATQVSERLPWKTVEMLRALPPRSVVAADPSLGLAVPMVSDQFVMTSGTNFTTDLHYLATVQRVLGHDFQEADVDMGPYIARLGPSLAAGLRPDIVRWEAYRHRQRLLAEARELGVVPVFNPAEPADTTLALLDVLDPDFLLVEPERHPHLVSLAAAMPRRFTLVGTDGRFTIYRHTAPPTPSS